MATKYNTPSVESIMEDSEDEEIAGTKHQEGPHAKRTSNSHHRSLEPSAKLHSGKERERSRKHKSTSGSKHSKKTKSATARRGSVVSPKDSVSNSSRRHRSNPSGTSSTSSSSDEEEDKSNHDHKTKVAGARARLTSPSTISSFTTQTTVTNKSSSSSGSNSTITQSSLTKRSTVGKTPEDDDDDPLSPAVPDPPNVFAFLEEASPADEKEDENDRNDEGPKWPLDENAEIVVSFTSSASSSFQGDDNLSEPAVDNDTDRSSSPEPSVKEHSEAQDLMQPPAPSDPMSAKIASQIAAAQQRQNHYAIQNLGTPELSRGQVNHPHVPPIALSPRYIYQSQQILPRVEKLPVTGYELLASHLTPSSNGDMGGPRIKPMYRKFEALNHRLLLHLQDELSELEEQLHRLDHVDTQSRRTDRSIIPASRRAAAQAGGELQWHKTEILGRIGYKLNQYNAALASFNSTKSLIQPAPKDIERYRSYLQSEHPIADSETHFLDPAYDLVSLCSEHELASPQSETSYTTSSFNSTSITPSMASRKSSRNTSRQSPNSIVRNSDDDVVVSSSSLSAIATAIAFAVIIPILTFNVIPGFLGRLTVSFLVTFFMISALIQSETLDQNTLLGQEGVVCVGIYTGVMIVIAGVMA